VIPPFIGVAVKVTDVPGQILLALGDTVTNGVTGSLTAIEIVLLVTGCAQATLEVKITVTF
jgi:hypothetical protein